MERLQPKPSTVRALFAKSGNECAFPGCDQPLVDDLNLLVAEVCHINAVRDLDARYDASVSAEGLRNYDNLILLCHAHHVRVDSLPGVFSVGALKQMRQAHERKVESRVYNVSDDTVDDALFQLLDSDWEPYFEPAIDLLLADIDKARGGQSGMNWMSQQIGELLDASLYILNLRILSAASISSRRRLLREHREWVEMRDAEAHEYSLEMEGGSAQPLLYNSRYNSITKKRIALLRCLDEVGRD